MKKGEIQNYMAMKHSFNSKKQFFKIKGEHEMSIEVFKKCFVKTSKGIIAMAFYESYGTKRWGILAPLETIELSEVQFIRAIKNYCFSCTQDVFVIENNRDIHFGFEAYQWYLQGISEAKRIEEYLDKESSAYCILRDGKGRERIRKFLTTGELERIIALRKDDILSIGIVKKGQKVEKDINRYVLSCENGGYIKYKVDGSICLCELKDATIFPSKRMAAATAKGCPYDCKEIKYRSAVTYNGRRYIIALITSYKQPLYVNSITQIGFEVTDTPNKARKFYKKQGEKIIKEMSCRFELTPRSHFELIELKLGGTQNE